MKSVKFKIDNYPYVPRIWATILYFICVAFAFLLFAARTFEQVRFDFLLRIFPEYHTHISNFSITMMLVLVSGYTSVLESKSLKKAYIFAGLLIVINVVYEMFLPFLNTRDIIDAIYGIVGAVLPFAYLIPYQKVGVKENPNFVKL